MRRHILVSYDICDPKRLRRVHRLVKGYGDGVQYSVFLCQLSEKDEVILRERLHDLLNHREDQVIMLRLGEVDKSNKLDSHLRVIGKKLEIMDLRTLIF